MQDATLSPWFNLDEKKPWGPGVYMVPSFSTLGGNMFSYWNGLCFNGGWLDIDRAYKNMDYGDCGNYKKWRGLSSDPSPKPKPRGNPKVTRYVVMEQAYVVAVYESMILAKNHASRVKAGYVQKIRFRSPEASKK